MGEDGAFADSTTRSQLFPILRFAWGLIPGVPAKSETGAEPTDIILRLGPDYLVFFQCTWVFYLEVSPILSLVFYTKSIPHLGVQIYHYDNCFHSPL